MTPRNPYTVRPHAPRRGFTLLEVVIATLLVAVLMGAVYQTLYIYRMMFERGETQTEEIQLIRTLSQQLSDDLVGAIQDPVFVDPMSRGPSGARRFGLFGTATELRIDVLQIPAFQIAPTPTAQEMADTTEPRKLQAPELQTVYYSFYDTASLDSTLPDSRVGLTRRELDFETPEPLDTADPTELAGVSLSEETPTEELPAVAAASTFDRLLEVGADSSVMWAPEVVSLRFRYFDGSRWRKSWDSLARKGLPVAVEMRLAVVSLADADAFRGTSSVIDMEFETGTPGSVSVESADDLTAESAESGEELEREVTAELDEPAVEQAVAVSAPKKQPTLHMHRVVVHLPNSPLMRERKAVRRQAAPTLETPTLAKPTALPKAILQPAQPKQPGRRVAPDQWMRNE